MCLTTFTRRCSIESWTSTLRRNVRDLRPILLFRRPNIIVRIRLFTTRHDNRQLLLGGLARRNRRHILLLHYPVVIRVGIDLNRCISLPSTLRLNLGFRLGLLPPFRRRFRPRNIILTLLTLTLNLNLLPLLLLLPYRPRRPSPLLRRHRRLQRSRNTNDLHIRILSILIGSAKRRQHLPLPLLSPSTRLRSGPPRTRSRSIIRDFPRPSRASLLSPHLPFLFLNFLDFMIRIRQSRRPRPRSGL